MATVKGDCRAMTREKQFIEFVEFVEFVEFIESVEFVGFAGIATARGAGLAMTHDAWILTFGFCLAFELWYLGFGGPPVALRGAQNYFPITDG
jgi:hypothetical protein